MMRINGVYLTRNNIRATVWYKAGDEKMDQYFVRDERGYDFEVNGAGKYYFVTDMEHPLDLVADTGATGRFKKEPRGHKSPPEVRPPREKKRARKKAQPT